MLVWKRFQMHGIVLEFFNLIHTNFRLDVRIVAYIFYNAQIILPLNLSSILKFVKYYQRQSKKGVISHFPEGIPVGDA